MSKSTEHIAALTGIRALAALWVVVYHFRAVLFGWFPELRAVAPLLDEGHLGVDLFFVLSGFILAYNYLERLGERPSWEDWGRFLWLRLARIYPVHLFTIGVLALLLLGAWLMGIALNRAEAYGGGELLANLLLVHGWGLTEGLSWNRPSWSISAEWFAYLLFPLLAWAVLRIRRQWLVVALALLVLALRLAAWELVARPEGTLVRIATEFLAGMLLHRIYVATRGGRWPWPVVAGGAAALVPATLLLGAHGDGVVPLFAVLVLALAHGQGLLARLLATRVLVFGGEISYALYMTHAIALMVLAKLGPSRLDAAPLLARLVAAVLVLALMQAVAALTYRFVEEPSRRLMRRFVRGPAGRAQARR